MLAAATTGCLDGLIAAEAATGTVAECCGLSTFEEATEKGGTVTSYSRMETVQATPSQVTKASEPETAVASRVVAACLRPFAEQNSDR